MKRQLIRYKMKPERADENERLIQAVFQELRDKSPDGVRYMTLRAADGTFIHLVETQTDAHSDSITGLATFKAFQRGFGDRCSEPPQRDEMAVIGSYRMLDA